MCRCAFTGFGQMIITNSSWGQTRSSFYANRPLSACFHWSAARRCSLEGVTSCQCSFMKKVRFS